MIINLAKSNSLETLFSQRIQFIMLLKYCHQHPLFVTNTGMFILKWPCCYHFYSFNSKR